MPLPRVDRVSRVVVVGDANPDIVLRGDVTPRFGQAEQLVDDATWTIGGSAAIVAHGLARLDRPVSLVAAVGGDVFAARLRTELTDAGVDVSALAERTGTPTGLTVVLSRTDDRAILTHPGAIPTLTAREVDAALVALDDVRHIHVASPFLTPDLTAELPGVLAAARAIGVTVSLDTNDDPAGRWDVLAGLLPHVDVLLPNRGEALALSGAHADDLEAAAIRLVEAVPLVVIKDGDRGALALARGGSPVHVPAAPVSPVDTTGAGDTFDAAFVDAWLADRPLHECLDRATRAGALSVGGVGGTAAQPTRAQLEPLSAAAPGRTS